MARLPSLYGDEEDNPIQALLGVGTNRSGRDVNQRVAWDPRIPNPREAPEGRQGSTYRPWQAEAQARDARVGRSDDEDFAEWFSKAPMKERARWAASEIVSLADPANDMNAEEKPSLRQQFGEAFATSLRPELGPMIQQRQLDRRTKQEVMRKQRMSAIDVLMGLPGEEEEEDPRILNVPGVGVFQVPPGGFPSDQTPAPVIPYPQERQEPVDFENVPGVPGYVRKPGSMEATRLGGIPKEVSAPEGDVDRLPAQVIVESLRGGMNPYPPGHALNQIAGKISEVLRAQPDETLQRLYAKILTDTMEGHRGYDKKLKPDALPLAMEEADQIFKAVTSRAVRPGTPAPGGDDVRAKVNARGAELASQGVPEAQILQILRAEFPQAFQQQGR